MFEWFPTVGDEEANAMAIQFACRQCHKLLRVGEEYAGRPVRCPYCRATFACPAPTLPADPAATVAWQPTPEGDAAPPSAPDQPQLPEQPSAAPPTVPAEHWERMEPAPPAPPAESWDWPAVALGLRWLASGVMAWLVGLPLWAIVTASRGMSAPASVWTIALARPMGAGLVLVLTPTLIGLGLWLWGLWRCRRLASPVLRGLGLAALADGALAGLFLLIGTLAGLLAGDSAAARVGLVGGGLLLALSVAIGTALLGALARRIDQPRLAEQAVKLVILAAVCPILVGLFGSLMELTASVMEAASKRELALLVLWLELACGAGLLAGLLRLVRRVEASIGEGAAVQ